MGDDLGMVILGESHIKHPMFCWGTPPDTMATLPNENCLW